MLKLKFFVFENAHLKFVKTSSQKIADTGWIVKKAVHMETSANICILLRKSSILSNRKH